MTYLGLVGIKAPLRAFACVSGFLAARSVSNLFGKAAFVGIPLVALAKDSCFVWKHRDKVE